MISSVKLAESPFASEGGVPYTPRTEEHPFHALDELMAAVEALCPTWPPRETFVFGSRMLL